MGGLSIAHFLILAVLVLLLLGGSRFSTMMGDFAKGIKTFKRDIADDPQVPYVRDHSAPSDVRHDGRGAQQPSDEPLSRASASHAVRDDESA